jgi:hypothetical protein
LHGKGKYSSFDRFHIALGLPKLNRCDLILRQSAHFSFGGRFFAALLRPYFGALRGGLPRAVKATYHIDIKILVA